MFNMKINIHSCVVIIIIVLLMSNISSITIAQEDLMLMHRLYNPNSGEHFYTGDINEKDSLVKYGWKYEGIGWTAPKMSDSPVYRLYNKNSGDHHYTMNRLIGLGWNDEGIGWYSDDKKEVPLYRQYNPNAITGNHNYTTDKTENDWLVGLGWKPEGIGWYSFNYLDVTTHGCWVPEGKGFHFYDSCPSLSRSKTIIYGTYGNSKKEDICNNFSQMKCKTTFD